MKRETKELLKWLEDLLNRYKIRLMSGREELGWAERNRETDRAFEAIDFLRSLPDIEKHLCRGGYIQDSNGIPCCEGDVIEYKDLLSNEIVKGTLYWSINDKCFYAKIDNKPRSISTYFKKVDK